MIDVSLDLTEATPGFWDGFWERNDGLGAGGADPDSSCAILQEYHKKLWSKQLPNGEFMDLQMSSDPYYYLTWKNFRFGSDSIIVEFRYHKYKYMLDKIAEATGDFKGFFEKTLRRTYTVGGTIIFPKHPFSMNQTKGTSSLVSDRWDLTLECIRRYYNGEDSPLYKTIVRDKDFFDLFVDFKGYVDYFFLQDAVSPDYSNVNIWCGDGSFTKSGLPETLDEYFNFLDNEFDFMDKRNARIKEYAEKHRL